MKTIHPVPGRIVSLAGGIFLLSVFVLCVAPNLLSEGMFMDGMIYSVVAHNLAMGEGSFWHLTFSDTSMHAFFGHPPLGIYLQSFVYRCFGNALWLDKLYSLGVILVQALLIVPIWREWFRQPIISWSEQVRPSSRWALIFFLLSPLIIWAATNNLLESTLSVFLEISLWAYLRFKRTNQWFYLLLSGFGMAAGCMTKALVGLFLWGMPLAYRVCVGSVKQDLAKRRKNLNRNLCAEVLWLIFTTLIPFLLLYLFVPQARYYAAQYWQEQIVHSFSNIVTVSSRFYILERFFWESLPMMVLLLMAYVLRYFRLKHQLPEEKICPSRGLLLSSAFFLLISAFGVLPLMISLKQRTFYLMSVWPFVAMAFGLLMPTLMHTRDRLQKVRSLPGHSARNARIWLVLSIGSLILSVSACFYFAKRPGRQQQMLNDVHQVIRIVPAHTTLQISPTMVQNWSLYGYFARYANISLDPRPESRHTFLLVETAKLRVKDSVLLKEYQRLPVNLQMHRLYQLKSDFRPITPSQPLRRESN